MNLINLDCYLFCFPHLQLSSGSTQPCCNKDFSPREERYYNIQITAQGKLIGLINEQVNDDTVNTFH